MFWREAKFKNVVLRRVYQQKNVEFVAALANMCEAKFHTERVKKFLNEHQRRIELPEGCVATILYSRNKDVDKENMDRLSKIEGEEKIFESNDLVLEDKENILKSASKTPKTEEEDPFVVGAVVRLKLKSAGVSSQELRGSKICEWTKEQWKHLFTFQCFFEMSKTLLTFTYWKRNSMCPSYPAPQGEY